jgi:hypothetical protein
MKLSILTLIQNIFLIQSDKIFKCDEIVNYSTKSVNKNICYKKNLV